MAYTKIMNQIFEHYEKWEDYKAGMFSIVNVCDKDKKVSDAINLLSSQSKFYEASKKMMQQWPISTDVNLTNKGQNRRAWIGAAACMFECNAPEILTSMAWNSLSKENQNKANAIADKLIHEFETKQSNVKTLFG